MATNALLYDSGRLSPWLRGPLLAVGLLLAWLATELAAYGLSGHGLLLRISAAVDTHGSPLLASLVMLALAALFCSTWVARVRVEFDAAQNSLVVRTRWFRDRTLSLANCLALHLRYVRTGLADHAWKASLEFTDGRDKYLLYLGTDQAGVEQFADAFRAATRLPAAWSA